MYKNRYEALQFPVEPTDYEDFDDIRPYNLLKNGDWKSLYMNPHPLYHIIGRRFNPSYEGKLLWSELKIMEEKIKKQKDYVDQCEDRFFDCSLKLRRVESEQTKLCREFGKQQALLKLDTIFLSALSERNIDNQTLLSSFMHKVDDAMLMMNYILSFIETTETCAQKLQKHLNECKGFDGTGKYKCTIDDISYDCQFKNDNGRCCHYYEIEKAKEEFEFIYHIRADELSDLLDMEYHYKKALAIKTNTLDKFNDYDSDYY